MAEQRNFWRPVVIGGLSVALGLGLLAALWLLARPLGLLIMGISLAATLAPIATRLERRIPRTVAILLVYVTLLLILAAILVFTVPRIFHQAALALLRAPGLINSLQQSIDRNNLYFPTLSQAINTQITQLGPMFFTFPLKVSESILDIIFVFFISIYALFEGPAIRSFLLTLFPEDRHVQLTDIMSEITTALGGYLRAALLNGLIMGIAVYIGLRVLRVEYPAILGTLAGFMELIPLAGPFLAAAPILFVALLESPTKALITLIFLFILQETESHILVPNIVRTQTDLSPLLALLALFAGASVGGLLGALVAIPIVAVLRVLVRRVIAPAISRYMRARSVISDQ